jgi:hypothetical protein
LLSNPEDVALALTSELADAPSGVGFVYRCLDDIVSRWRLRDALVVVDDPTLGRQVLRARRAPAEGQWAANLAAHARPGLYTEPIVIERAGLGALHTLCRIALRLETQAAAAAIEDRVDLALRQLDGVIAVGTQLVEHGALAIVVSVAPGTDLEEVRADAQRLVEQHDVAVLSLSVVRLAGAPPVGRGRVRLLGVVGGAGGRDDEAEVHVSLGPRHAVGHGRSGRRLDAVVDATLDAVHALEVPLPYHRGSAEELHPAGEESVTVAVLLAAEDEARYGIAAAATVDQAAARATLDALNRRLALV